MAIANGIKKVSATSENQILFVTDPQVSIGVIVSQAVQDSPNVDGRKIVKAGTPLSSEFMKRNKPAVLADGSEHHMVGVLLHDVDVTDGDANGTMLIFGFVNYNRLEKDVQTKINTVVKAEQSAGVLRPVYFLKDTAETE